MSEDLIEKSEQLDQEIVAIPKDKVFTKRTVVTGFLFIVGSICLSFGITAYRTNQAVTHEIPGLKDQIADQKEVISDDESVINQATDAILLLFQILRDNGIEPPEIVIKPED